MRFTSPINSNGISKKRFARINLMSSDSMYIDYNRCDIGKLKPEIYAELLYYRSLYQHDNRVEQIVNVSKYKVLNLI